MVIRCPSWDQVRPISRVSISFFLSVTASSISSCARVPVAA